MRQAAGAEAAKSGEREAGDLVIGELAALGCALTWAMTSILIKPPVVKMGPVSVNTLRTWVGATVFLTILLATDRLGLLLALPPYTVFALVCSMAIGLGIGLSPYFELEVALLLVVGYLGLSINVYLETAVMQVFRLAYGRVGPTEARILLALAAAALGVTALAGAPAGPLTLGANVVGLVLATAMLVMLGWRCAGNLRKLAALEPRPRMEVSSAG